MLNLKKLIAIQHFFLTPVTYCTTISNNVVHKKSVPHNTLCPTGVFKSNSKIECASSCLLRDNYNNCTAFTFDILLEEMPCMCKRAKCIPDPPDTGIETPTNVLISMKCDTSKIGTVNIQIFQISHCPVKILQIVIQDVCIKICTCQWWSF